MRRTIAIAADHGGFALKDFLKTALADLGIDWLDLGTDSVDSVDYPDYGDKIARAIMDGQAACGIAICGTGIGISIAVNRHAPVRAALCTDVTMARLARQHNDAQVLCLGGRITGPEAALDIVKTFLNTPFDGGARHERRIAKLNPKER